MTYYEPGSVVWVQLTGTWWPGKVKSADDCPIQYLKDLKKDPLAIVKFFNERGFHHVTKQEQIFSYNCNRKMDFIRKGLNSVKDDVLNKKFEKDIVIAEKLTGGNMDIVAELKQEITNNKRRIDYSDLGFGVPKNKKALKYESQQKRGFTNIGEAILYKKGKVLVEEKQQIKHVVKIMEQKPKSEEELQLASNSYKCYICGYQCDRLNVIVWHNKAHLKKVEDYDAGIIIPSRWKRKPRRSQVKKRKTDKQVPVNHTQVNGHTSPKSSSQETRQLLLDWEDEDEEEGDAPRGTEPNGVVETEEPEDGLDDSCENDDHIEDSDGDEYDDNYPPPQPRRERQPMPNQNDIDSAFDALLADSSSVNNRTSTNHNSSYINNDSDSDCSGWEKYYDNDSDSRDAKDGGQRTVANRITKETAQNGHYSSDKIEEAAPTTDKMSHDTSSSTAGVPLSVPSASQKEGDSESAKPKTDTISSEPQSPGPHPSVSECPSPLPDRATGEPSEDHSSQSSSSNSSTSSGPAYMLVAVDAHGNNVPMPVLSEGGSHLVAVEASMEDGTTRTLYIDPAHLGPNVDLNNLMLHIDNSGQETVIIPTSTSDGEIISSTLIDQPLQDSLMSAAGSSINEGDTKHSKEVSEKRRGSHLVEEENEETRTSKLSKSKKSKTGKSKSDHSDQKKSKSRLDSGTDEKIYDPSSSESATCIRMGARDLPSEDIDDLPDLETSDFSGKHKLYAPDELVWVMTNGNWWPSYVVKAHPKDNMVSILYINCQQSTPVKVSLNRLKSFTFADFPDIYETQKNKAVGLTEAMDVANQYKTLREEKIMKESPKEFFSLPVSDQRSLINRMSLVRRGVPLEMDTLQSSAHPSSPTKPSSSSSSSTICSGGEKQQKSPQIDKGKQLTPKNLPLSKDTLSEREKHKLLSAKSARKSDNERFIHFIRSEACLDHLRSIIRGSVFSQRHDDFKLVCRQPHYLMHFSSKHNPAIEFFDVNDTTQTEAVVAFLESQFMKRDLSFLDDLSHRKIYTRLVLFPEAIKESLRVIAKVPEEMLEVTLETGVYETPTEKKARKLEYGDF